MENLRVKITSPEPFWWYERGDDEGQEVSQVETEISFKELLDEIASEGYTVNELGHKPRTFIISFNNETITWKF